MVHSVTSRPDLRALIGDLGVVNMIHMAQPRSTYTTGVVTAEGWAEAASAELTDLETPVYVS